MYPQPLLKQAEVGVPVDYNDYDIIAEFNSQYPFYFGPEGANIPDSSVDFECNLFPN